MCACAHGTDRPTDGRTPDRCITLFAKDAVRPSACLHVPFLQRDAMRVSVCPSVCPSQAGTVPKRLNAGSCKKAQHDSFGVPVF